MVMIHVKLFGFDICKAIWFWFVKLYGFDICKAFLVIIQVTKFFTSFNYYS